MLEQKEPKLYEHRVMQSDGINWVWFCDFSTYLGSYGAVIHRYWREHKGEITTQATHEGDFKLLEDSQRIVKAISYEGKFGRNCKAVENSQYIFSYDEG
jgi:hypothetical protein